MTYFYNKAARLRELDARSQTNNIIKRRMDNYRIGMVDPPEEDLHAKSGLELSQSADAQAQLFEKQVGELFKHPQDAMEFKRLFPVNDIPYLGAILSKLQLMFRGSSPAPKTVVAVAVAQISQLTASNVPGAVIPSIAASQPTSVFRSPYKIKTPVKTNRKKYDTTNRAVTRGSYLKMPGQKLAFAQMTLDPNSDRYWCADCNKYTVKNNKHSIITHNATQTHIAAVAAKLEGSRVPSALDLDKFVDAGGEY